MTIRGDAALWLDQPADTPQRRCQLIFDRERCEGQWEDEGKKREAFGFLSAVTASLAWGVAEDIAKEKKNPDLSIPISAGLSATRFLRFWGHGPVKPAGNQTGIPEFPFAEVAEHIRHEVAQHLKKPEHFYVSAAVRREGAWTILGQISPWRKAENLPLYEPARRVALLGPGSLMTRRHQPERATLEITPPIKSRPTIKHYSIPATFSVARALLPSAPIQDTALSSTP